MKEKGARQHSRIVIGNGYEILVDSMNYALAYNTGQKRKDDGEPVYRFISYHGSLDKALSACKKEFARKGLTDVKTPSLDDAISIIVNANNHFESLVKNAFEGVET